MAENRKHSVKLGRVNHMHSDLEVVTLEEVSLVGMVASQSSGKSAPF